MPLVKLPPGQVLLHARVQHPEDVEVLFVFEEGFSVAPELRDHLRSASSGRVDVFSHQPRGVAHPPQGLHGSNSGVRNPPPAMEAAVISPACTDVRRCTAPKGMPVWVSEAERSRSARCRASQSRSCHTATVRYGIGGIGGISWRKPLHRHGSPRVKEELVAFTGGSVAFAGGLAVPVLPRLPSAAPMNTSPLLSHTTFASTFPKNSAPGDVGCGRGTRGDALGERRCGRAIAAVVVGVVAVYAAVVVSTDAIIVVADNDACGS